MTAGDLATVAGNGGQELRTWLVMAAALGFAPGTPLAYAPMTEWLTGMGVAVLDPPTTTAGATR
jgi:2,3-dihydroxyphenylpropionate 1,2-dioxygenase